MCDRIASDDSLMIYCPHKYKTENMCDEAVDDCLAALNLSLAGLLQVKSSGKIFMMLYSLRMIYFFDEDFSKVIFFANEMGIYF